jgi:hypothetical protein
MDSGLECLKNVSVSDDPKIASFALHTSDSWETVNVWMCDGFSPSEMRRAIGWGTFSTVRRDFAADFAAGAATGDCRYNL